MHTRPSLQNLYAFILNDCYSIHPKALQKKLCATLCDDLGHRLREQRKIATLLRLWVVFYW